MGMTLDEAENSLALDRPGGLSMEQWRQTAITQELVERMKPSAKLVNIVDQD